MFLLAAEYEYPEVVPDCLPNNPFKFGPMIRINKFQIQKTHTDPKQSTENKTRRSKRSSYLEIPNRCGRSRLDQNDEQ